MPSRALVPLMLNPIKAGFPNPADDPIDQMIDFNDLIIKHPAATFALRVEGDSMSGLGIFPNDIVVIDRSLQAKNGDIVVASIDGEFTLKTLQKLPGKQPELHAANKNYAPIVLSDLQHFEVWGVVTHVVHDYRNGK